MPFSEELDDSMKLFLDSLKEEYELFKKVYVKAEQERQAIVEMDLDRLKVIIHDKQALLDRSSAIEGRIGEMRKVWQEAKDFIRPELSREIASFIEGFSVFMQKLVEFEKNNEQIFVDKHKITESELDQLRLAKKASKAYFDKPHSSPGQTDIIG